MERGPDNKPNPEVKRPLETVTPYDDLKIYQNSLDLLKKEAEDYRRDLAMFEAEGNDSMVRRYRDLLRDKEIEIKDHEAIVNAHQ